MNTKYIIIQKNTYGLDFSPFSLSLGIALHKNFDIKGRWYLIFTLWPLALWLKVK